MKTILFPPVNISQEMKLRHLLETIENYMNTDIEVDFTIKNNIMVMKASFPEDREDIEEIVQAIANIAWVKI